MNCRGFESVCSNDDCRRKFSDIGLAYSDINEGDILALVLLLNEEIRKSVKAGETSVNTIRLSKKIDMKTDEKGRIVSCFLYMNSHYFSQRECISFNKDGWIGFAGWADTGNLNPIKRAFLKWCDILKKQKEEFNK